MKLRDYQLKALEEVDRHRRPLVVAPTGSGKTVIASEIIRRAENRHVLFLAHRRELIFQSRRHLADFDVNAGVILAGEALELMKGVQLASIQTLWSRCMRGSTDLPHADIVFIDEAHHCRARTYRRIIESYPDAKIIGMTATPCRRDGRGLGSTFDALVECPQIDELIRLGHLVRTVVYAPSTPDLTGVHTRQGDYVELELAERVDRPELVGDVVSHWHRLAERRKTVVFATNVKHSIHLAEEFAKSGVKAAHIDGTTPKPERDEILERLSAGDLELVTNCGVLVEGWDQPDVSCCVLARPTKSMGLYRQMAGRVIRPAPGKPDALILDHAGATFRHGFIEDPVRWTLDEDERVETPEQLARIRMVDGERGLLTCTECSAVRTAGRACPQCGFMPKRRGEHLDVIDGDLARLDRNGRLHPHLWTAEMKNDFQRQLLGIVMQRGYKPGWAAHKFKERFGHWPHISNLEPKPPTDETLAWERSRRIAWAKAREKEAAAHG